MPPESPSNDELVVLILPWAKANKPEPYKKTLTVARNPDVFRRYLLRLVELRATEDKEWRNSQCPLAVLDQTSLSITVRHRATGEIRTYQGEGATPPIKSRIWELSLPPEEFTALQQLKSTFDLVYHYDGIPNFDRTGDASDPRPAATGGSDRRDDGGTGLPDQPPAESRDRPHGRGGKVPRRPAAGVQAQPLLGEALGSVPPGPAEKAGAGHSTDIVD